jgi:hypothetical protein
MPLYDFRCDLGCNSEVVRPIGTEVIPCPNCGVRACRTHVPSRFDVVGPTVDTRGMARRFAEAVDEREHGFAQIEARTGEAYLRPDDWSRPKAKAKERARRGEIDPAMVRPMEHQSIRGVQL